MRQCSSIADLPHINFRRNIPTGYQGLRTWSVLCCRRVCVLCGHFSGSNSAHFLQCNQPGHQVRHAQLQDAPESPRDGGHGLQNTGWLPAPPGMDSLCISLKVVPFCLSVCWVRSFIQGQASKSTIMCVLVCVYVFIDIVYLMVHLDQWLHFRKLSLVA